MKSGGILLGIVFVMFLSILFYRRKLLFFRKWQKIVYIHPAESSLKHFYEPSPNTMPIELNEAVDRVRYTINSDSLNEQIDYAIAQPQNAFRIIALGDSYTFGVGVATSKNWVKALERMLNKSFRSKNIKKIEVINFGVDGYDIEYSVERFRLRGVKYNPDLVLWFLNDSDFSQINEIIIPLKRRYKKEMEETGELESKRKAGDYYPYTRKAKKEMIEAIGGNDALNRYQTDALLKLRDYYKGKLIIFTSKDFMPEEWQDIFRNLSMQDNNIIFYDGLTNFHKNSTLIFSDKHPNKNGHALIAKDFFNFLKDNKVIP